jgi:hypothetical protein
MRGAVVFHSPARQQQSEDDEQHCLLLFRQPVHAAQYSRKNTEGQQCDFIYDLRIMIDAIKLRLPVKS